MACWLCLASRLAAGETPQTTTDMASEPEKERPDLGHEDFTAEEQAEVGELIEEALAEEARDDDAPDALETLRAEHAELKDKSHVANRVMSPRRSGQR